MDADPLPASDLGTTCVAGSLARSLAWRELDLPLGAARLQRQRMGYQINNVVLRRLPAVG